ncbi:hypothetical protein Hdeb2414_s0002g00046201 [Helianthus debilis subsp. tardiflorus]
MNTMTMMMLTMIEVSPVSAVRISNKWYQSAWLENEELGSELRDPDPGKMRMKKMENKHGKRRETDSDSDYMSPRLRAIAILKQEIAIMELQDEIALMEYESGRHEDNGDVGEVMTRKEEDVSERDEMACEDVLDKKKEEQETKDDHEEEEEENRSRIYDSGHTRMKKENRGYGNGQESNPDRTTPRSREFAEWKQDILMKVEHEIDLLERESEGRQGETGKFENPMSSELFRQETEDDEKVMRRTMAQISDKQRKGIATETGLLATDEKVVATTDWKLSDPDIENFRTILLGITKQIKVDLWTNHDKFKEKCVYHQSRRDEPLPMLSLGDGVRNINLAFIFIIIICNIG